MPGKSIIVLLIALVLSAGCKTPAPVLKPNRSQDQLVEPPAGRDSPNYPRESFDNANYPPKPPTAVNHDLIPTTGFGSASGSRYGPYKF